MGTISFKKTGQGEESIFVDDVYIGSVILDLWNSKWSCKPAFKQYGKNVEVKEKFYSSYKAGKTMVDLYNKIQSRKKKAVDPFDSTEEFFIKDFFDNID
tara:strand:+ start:622 stop:918 length:297 start_codon:yes stop_codon:yes gene_type:complete